MTAHQFRAIITKIPLSQVQTAHTLGVSPHTVRRWALDKGSVTLTAAKLLRLMKTGTLTPQKVKNA